MSRRALIERLQRRLGLDPESIGEATLHHGLDEACAELGARDASELLVRIDRNDADWQRFIDCMVVPETWLFRVPEQFEDLLRHLRELPAARRPLRVLSLPCASGEEVWSIVATLVAGGFAPGSFEVLGIDVSARAIEAARRARYRRSALRGREADPDWFEWDGDWLSPQAALLRCAQFRVGNVLQPGLFAAGERFDVVFCRNLMIYLEEDARRQALQQLLQVLEPDGMLLAGQAEVLSAIDRRLQPLPGRGPLSFGWARPAPAVSGGAPAPAAAPLRRREADGRRGSPAPAGSGAGTQSPRRHDATAREDAPEAPPASSAVDAALAGARSAADAGRLDEARAACRECLDAQPESVPAWFLLGVVEAAAGALDAADAAFARAGYLDRSHHDALLHRAALAERRGQAAEAARLRAQLTRMRAAGAPP